jgi:SAM-dependent methyltransferase
MKNNYPICFMNVRVLDVGSLDINGGTRQYFNPAYYIGIDLAPGKGVDVISPGHLYDSGFLFDVVTTSECLEHDMYWPSTLKNMARLLRPNGLFVGTCATLGRPEHGTRRTTPSDAPLLPEGWNDYYMNLTERDIRSALDDCMNGGTMYFEVNSETHDLYFYGFKG